MRREFKLFIVLSLIAGAVTPAFAVRIKDIADLKGVRENQLMGYGLVVGLNGTGDGKIDATAKSLAQMFKQMGVDVSEKVDSKNVAAVIVTAELPAFARAGTHVEVVVNSVGDAKSLVGGTLLMTPLKAADQNIYVVAQGPIVVGGGGEGKGHPTVGRLPNGGIVERELRIEFDRMKSLRLTLRASDFTTNARISKVINVELAGKYASSRDARTVDIVVPFQYENRVVDLVALIENLEVTTDMPAKVVVNEKTGTVVMGENVKLETCSLAHGNLTISVEEETSAEPKAKDRNVASAKKGGKGAEKVSVMEIPKATRIKDVVKALNALGVKSKDLVDILQALRAAGALHADLEIM